VDSSLGSAAVVGYVDTGGTRAEGEVTSVLAVGTGQVAASRDPGGGAAEHYRRRDAPGEMVEVTT
jgi:hypothetical protein